MFYKNQIESAKNIMNIFSKNTVFWVLLCAEMQSGKTGTYIFLAFEMLRTERVEYVIVINGNNEKELREQLHKDFKSYLSSYLRYLARHIYLEEEDYLIDEIKDKIIKRFAVKFGHELTTGSDRITDNSLIVWDESHYAQYNTNRPSKYFHKNKIEATGNPEYLKERNIHILSVSATPFSEYSDIEWLNQYKEVFHMKPGVGYIGVKDFYKNNYIIGFDDKEEKLKDILKHSDKNSKKYGIIRLTSNDDEKFSKICVDNGWIVKHYNNEVKDIISIDSLEVEPDCNTAIFIKEMCRLGKVVPKKYISFMMESNSIKTNTDTLLQGLPGRACGYNKCISDIRIYIHNNFFKTDTSGDNEITKFLKFMEGEKKSVSKAKNLLSILPTKSDVVWHSAVPIKIPNYIGSEDDDKNKTRDEYMPYREAVRISFKNGDIENYNSEEQISEIKKQVENIDNVIFRVRKITGKNIDGKALPITYAKVPETLVLKKPFILGNGCGFESNDSENIIMLCYIFTTDAFEDIGIRQNDAFLICRTKSVNIEECNINRTTKKETFSRTLNFESSETIANTDSYSLSIKPETCSNIDLMYEEIEYFIKLSEKSANTARYITSNKDAFSSKWDGILVTDEVFLSLLKNGEIYNKIKNNNPKLKIKLKVHKAVGKQVREKNMIRLTKISW